MCVFSNSKPRVPNALPEDCWMDGGVGAISKPTHLLKEMDIHTAQNTLENYINVKKILNCP